MGRAFRALDVQNAPFLASWLVPGHGQLGVAGAANPLPAHCFPLWDSLQTPPELSFCEFTPSGLHSSLVPIGPTVPFPGTLGGVTGSRDDCHMEGHWHHP